MCVMINVDGGPVQVNAELREDLQFLRFYAFSSALNITSVNQQSDQGYQEYNMTFLNQSC